MDYISQHLTSLRQEITDLRHMNSLYSERTDHTPVERSALEVRTNRLLQIKQELSHMLNRPREAAVWWDKFAARNRAQS